MNDDKLDQLITELRKLVALLSGDKTPDSEPKRPWYEDPSAAVVKDMAICLYAAHHDISFGEGEERLYNPRWNHMARLAIEHIPYLEKLATRT